MSSILDYKFKAKDLLSKKEELLGLIIQFMAYDKLDFQGDGAASDIEQAIVQSQTSTELTTQTTTETTTAINLEEQISLIEKLVISGNSIAKDNLDKITAILEEDEIEDKLTFRATLNMLFHTLQDFLYFLHNPLESNLFGFKNGELDYISKNPEGTVLTIRINIFKSVIGYPVKPIDFCGENSCINIGSLTDYFWTGVGLYYEKNSCILFGTSTFFCQKPENNGIDPCMNVGPNVLYERECHIESSGPPPNQVINYGKMLVVTLLEGQREKFGNLELRENKIYILTAKETLEVSLFKKVYTLNGTGQGFNYEKTELPFSPEEVDRYVDHYTPSEYVDAQTHALFNTSITSILWGTLFLLGILMFKNRRAIQKIKEREKEMLKKEKLKKSQKKSTSFYLPSAPIDHQ